MEAGDASHAHDAFSLELYSMDLQRHSRAVAASNFVHILCSRYYERRCERGRPSAKRLSAEALLAALQYLLFQ